MTAADRPVLSEDLLARPRRRRRALLWGALVALLLVAQSLLVALTINYEAVREQETAERASTAAAADFQRELLRQMQALQALAFHAEPMRPGVRKPPRCCARVRAWRAWSGAAWTAP